MGHWHRPEPELDRLSNILKTFNDQSGTLFTDTDRVAKRIRDDIAPKVAADSAYQNAKENTPHTARMAHDQALGKVMQHLLKDDTQVYKAIRRERLFPSLRRRYGVCDHERTLTTVCFVWRSRMYARRPKQSHRDTVSYEIEMLEFCNRGLTETAGPVAEDKALYMEGFLLHYRNLIRFFSGLHHRGDDLNTADSKAWAGRNMTHAEVVAIKDAAIPLDDKYHGSISKYLQHCTRLRHELDRDWDVVTMKS